MKKSNRKTPFVFYLSLVLLTMTLFSAHFMSGLYARYTTVADGGDEARVAKFEVSENVKFGDTPVVIGAHELELMFKVDANGNFINPTYTFKVTNNSEVAVKYTVKTKNTDNLLLKFVLKNSEQAEVSEIALAPGASSTFYFEIQLSENDSKYSGMVDYIEITVTAEQID